MGCLLFQCADRPAAGTPFRLFTVMPFPIMSFSWGNFHPPESRLKFPSGHFPFQDFFFVDLFLTSK